MGYKKKVGMLVTLTAAAFFSAAIGAAFVVTFLARDVEESGAWTRLPFPLAAT